MVGMGELEIHEQSQEKFRKCATAKHLSLAWSLNSYFSAAIGIRKLHVNAIL